ncbi:hypothetical protein V495_02841 [Pseudogymnoascus sp. VKM F-4514 (FW-929)]|nr:hypothetical protein V495_02841 [Pseudogymnoascus sp. VKM F-4514 (FW-929)]KFY52519.1 hypothetical protein V497_08504 [Pseudogymnoascus sp. VKM F-4516 (FW-969)]
MLSLRSSLGVTAALKPFVLAKTAKAVVPQAARTFSILTPLRPSLTSSFAPRAPTTLSSAASVESTTTTTTGEILDLLPKISTHPSLAGIQEAAAWVFVAGEDAEGEGDAAEEEE